MKRAWGVGTVGTLPCANRHRIPYTNEWDQQKGERRCVQGVGLLPLARRPIGRKPDPHLYRRTNREFCRKKAEDSLRLAPGPYLSITPRHLDA